MTPTQTATPPQQAQAGAQQAPVRDDGFNSLLGSLPAQPVSSASTAFADKIAGLGQKPAATEAPAGPAELGHISSSFPNLPGAKFLDDTVDSISGAFASIPQDAKDLWGIATGPQDIKALVKGVGDMYGIAGTKALAGVGGAMNIITGGLVQKGVNSVADLITDDPKATAALNMINDTFDRHPEMKKMFEENIPGFLNLLGMAAGGDEAAGSEGPAASIRDTAGSMKDAATAGGSALTDAASAVAGKAKDVASAAVDKVMPAAEPVETTVGKVAQGSSSDVPSFQRGLSSRVTDNGGNIISDKIDTSGVKTYADLNKVASDKIAEASAKQDELLSQDKNQYKVQQLATKVGDKAAAHNYVIDAVDQLKTFYEKTNDVANLDKVKGYEAKLDPVKGEGLTLKDVNDIARMHGHDLSAYNANGELASGLTKQAAENTRMGLKNTVRNLLPDGTSKALDSQISDLYTVRDLSADMKEKVNTLSQRLQKPNILQKIGGLVGKAARFTGVGDLASNLLGIEKVPGAKTLSAVELEARLQRNLQRIDAAMKKDDAGFVDSVKDIINHPD